MFDIGFSELLLFGVIALIVLGPEKLPQAARSAGQWYAKIRRTISTLQSEIEAEFDLAETRQQMQQELAKIRQTEAEMRREIADMRGSMRQFEYAKSSPLEEYDKTDADDADSEHFNNALEPKPSTPNTQVINTRPWENMWFRLGTYDKARRLPPAPYLPNYRVDVLLNNNVDSLPDIESSVEQTRTLQKTDAFSPTDKSEL